MKTQTDYRISVNQLTGLAFADKTHGAGCFFGTYQPYEFVNEKGKDDNDK